MDKSVATSGDDWGYQPGKGGMAIEAKLGMFIIMILVSAFGFLVYRNVDRHQQQLLATSPPASGDSSESPPIEESPETPQTSPDAAVASSDSAVADPTLNDFTLEEPDLADRFAPAPIAEPQREASFAATEDSVSRDPFNDSAESDSAGFDPAPFDVAGLEDTNDAVDPFAIEPRPEMGAAREPLTDWTDDADSAEIASIDNAFPDDASEIEVGSTTLPVDSFSAPELDGVDEFDQALIFEDSDDQSIIPSGGPDGIAATATAAAPQLDSDPASPDDFDGWTIAGSETPEEIDERKSVSARSGLVQELQVADTETPAEPPRAIDEDPELAGDLAFHEDILSPEPRDAIAEDFATLPRDNSAAADANPVLVLDDDSSEPSPLDFGENELPQPAGRPDSQPELTFAARDDEFQADFPNSFEAVDVDPPRLPADPPLPDASNADPVTSTPAVVDATDSAFDEFALTDASDEAVIPLRPVTPTRGRHDASEPTRNGAEFSVPGFAYENSVITASAEEAPCDVCEVQPGDNYWRISRRFYGTTRYFSALALYNHHRVRDPKKLRPGMKILVPTAELLQEKYPRLFQDSAPRERKPSGYFVQSDGTPSYRIGERDTLSEIAQKHLGRSSRWIQIYRLNRNVLGNPNRLKPGTVIVLPDSATNVQMVP